MLKGKARSGAMRRGTVMMEFIIVFPIYLVLFAATFILGDMLIHSNRLLCGDVVAAFVGDFASRGNHQAASNLDNFFKKNVLKISSGGNQINPVDYRLDQYTATKDNGAWAMCAASTCSIGYRPPPCGVLGQLLSAEILLGGASSDSSALDDWRSGGYKAMRSKGGSLLFSSVFGTNNDRDSHRFYVLKRNRSGSHPDTGNWRWMTSGLLNNGYWATKVMDDGWHTGESIKARNTNPGTDQDVQNYAPGYKRYDPFVDVSY